MIFASNAARAWQTAEATAETLGLSVVRTCDLCEMHPGEAEGLTPQEMEARWGPTYAVVPGAMPYEEWLPAAVATLRSLVRAHDGQTIVGFTHTAVLNAAATVLSDLPVGDPLRFANGSISEWSSRDGTFEQIRLNETRHL